MMKEYDDTNTTIEEDDDNYGTPQHLFTHLCLKYGIYPQLDAAADVNNTKCQFFLHDAFHQEWVLGDLKPEIVDIWVNPPGSKQLLFIERAEAQHVKYGMKIMMIVPANCVSTMIWHKHIEGKREYYAIEGRPIFLKNGKKTSFPSRNSYLVILWR